MIGHGKASLGGVRRWDRALAALANAADVYARPGMRGLGRTTGEDETAGHGRGRLTRQDSDTFQNDTDQKVRGSNPFGRAPEVAALQRVGPVGLGDSQVDPYMDPYLPVGMAPSAVGAPRLA